MRPLAFFVALSALALAALATNYTGDSTNFTCCHLWCCYESSPYCGSGGAPRCPDSAGGCCGYACQPSQNATWVSLCGSGDFLEWTTPDLEEANYTLNFTGGCVAYGACRGDGYCLADLQIDGRHVAELRFADTAGNKSMTPTNYSYNIGSMNGTHRITFYYSNDCFSGSGGDRNIYVFGFNLTSNLTYPDIALNESEIWAHYAPSLRNRTFNPDAYGGRLGLEFIPDDGNIREGDAVGFVATVRNIGNKTAYNFSVRFKDDDDPKSSLGFYQERRVAELAAGAALNLTFLWKANGTTRNVSFFADSLREVSETNETNNIALIRVVITPKPVSPPDVAPLAWTTLIAIGLLALLAAALLAWRLLAMQKPAGPSKECPRCGMKVKPGARSCPVCGKKLGHA